MGAGCLGGLGLTKLQPSVVPNHGLVMSRILLVQLDPDSGRGFHVKE